MDLFNIFFGLIPERGYKYIVMALLGLLLFKNKIPILNKIDVRIKLPDEFMRHFRWITPLMLAGLYIWCAVLYAMLKAILQKLP